MRRSVTLRFEACALSLKKVVRSNLACTKLSYVSIADVISGARRGAKVTTAVMANVVGLDEERVRHLEAGDDEPTPDELDAYARAFGLRMAEFAKSGADEAPMTRLFFRSSETESGVDALQMLASANVFTAVGEFMRCVRDAAELSQMVGRARSGELPRPPKSLLEQLDGPPPHGGDVLADWFRSELELGVAPIQSMRQLVERVGVDVYWVTPEDLDPVIDGASTNTPHSAILVNLVEGPNCWWRTRMTLGHELCHLLCDASNGGNHRFALVSPHMQRSDRPKCTLFDGFDRIERRASAFSACLLAPDEAVRSVVGSQDPTSEIAIAQIGREFGLGRTTAINRLSRVFRLSRQIRESMQQRSAQHWPRAEHPDWAPDIIGLRSGVIAELACRAFADGRIDALRIREFLRLPLTESLPEHPRLTPELRAPLRSVQDKVRAIAQTYLREKYADVWDHWDIGVDAVESASGGWKARVGYRHADTNEPYRPSGHLLVSYDLKDVKDAEDFGLAEFVHLARRAAQGSG